MRHELSLGVVDAVCKVDLVREQVGGCSGQGHDGRLELGAKRERESRVAISYSGFTLTEGTASARLTVSASRSKTLMPFVTVMALLM